MSSPAEQAMSKLVSQFYAKAEAGESWRIVEIRRFVPC